MAVLLVEKHLGAHDDAHVGKRGGFGIGVGGIAVEFGCVGGGVLLGGKRRRRGVLCAYSVHTASKIAVMMAHRDSRFFDEIGHASSFSGGEVTCGYLFGRASIRASWNFDCQ